MKSEAGETLGSRQSATFEIPDREPALAFPLRRGTLSPAGQLQVDLKGVNVSSLNLSASRVYPNNLVAHVRGERPVDTARQVLTRTVPLALNHNAVTTLALDLRDLLGGAAPGVYVVRAQAADRCWTADSVIVTVSDLVITAKKERAGWLAWVTSLKTAAPVPNAQVTAMTRTNQTLATGTTDEQGLVRLAIPDDHPDGPLYLLTAQAGDDTNFLLPEDTTWVIDDVDQSGKPYPRTYDVMLYTERGIYRPGDTIHATGLIRDRDRATPQPFPLAVSLVRPDGKKVREAVLTPAADQQGFFHADFATDDDSQLGRYEIAVTLPGDKKPLGRTSALVEQYVPVRLEVTAEPTQPRFYRAASADDEEETADDDADTGATGSLVTSEAEGLPGATPALSAGVQDAQDESAASEDEGDDGDVTADMPVPTVHKSGSRATGSSPASAPIAVPQDSALSTQDSPAISVSARYLFGQPASDLPLKVTATYKRLSFKSARFPRYTFTDSKQDEEVNVPDIAATLDHTGHATVEVPLGADAAPGCWQAKVSATVSEPGGRSVSARTRIDLDTAGRHIGLLAPESKLLPINEPIHVDWVQLTPSDQLAKPLAMTWTLSRVDYDTTLQTVGHRLVWQSEERLTPVAKGTVATPNARGSLTVTCTAAGLYRLEVAATDCLAATRIEFHATADTGDDQMLAIDQPERLEVVLDQANYLPGSQAKVLIRSPFAGTLLLTLESDRVVHRQVLHMQANTAQLAVPIPEDLRGGAFVAASVVRPVDPSKDKWFPHRAAGLARLIVDHKAKALPVLIDVPFMAAPAARVTVTLRSDPPRDPARPPCVHLWAVDEGILKTIAYKTPDPLRHFLAPHEAAVLSADGFACLLPDYQRPASAVRIGGDDGSAESLRHSLVPSRHREAAVIWRTVVPVASDGTASAEVDLPDLTGEIRFMAVIVDQDRYGCTQQPVTLAAPLMVEATWPRFAAPGDRFQVPVKVFNATGTPLTVTLAAGLVEGPIEVALPADPRITVQPGQPATVWLTATATAMGQASVRLDATADHLVASAKADLPIRPASALHHEVRLARAPASQPITIAAPDVFLSGTVRATVSVGASPTVQMQSALEQLIAYPYGCVEQTTSRLLALLYAPDLLAGGPPDGRVDQVGNMIDAGIARLWSMQTLSGGLGYWPGERTADLWGTCYAAGFLLRARQAGYRVDRQLDRPAGRVPLRRSPQGRRKGRPQRPRPPLSHPGRLRQGPHRLDGPPRRADRLPRHRRPRGPRSRLPGR